jgi:hypothetical protein
MKWLATPPGKEAPTHVIDAPSEDILVSFARKRWGSVAWFCSTGSDAVEDIQVRLDRASRERAIGSGTKGEWSEWRST